MSAEPSMVHELVHDEYVRDMLIITVGWLGLLAIATVVLLLLG